MALVVDASVAVKWFVPEQDSDVAARLTVSGEDLHAPRLLAAELGNALWRKARVGEMNSTEARARTASVPSMPIHWHADETICADAVRLAIAYDRPVYDFMYLALAQRLGARVVTADQRFVNALAMTEHGDLVMALNDARGEE